MRLASILSIFSFFIFTYFGATVFKRNKKAILNIMFLILCLDYASWSFFSILQYSALSLSECLLWNKFTIPFSFLSIGIMMHFYIELCLGKTYNFEDK